MKDSSLGSLVIGGLSEADPTQGCAISGNAAGLAGGLLHMSGSAIRTRLSLLGTFSRNKAASQGGFLWVWLLEVCAGGTTQRMRRGSLGVREFLMARRSAAAPHEGAPCPSRRLFHHTILAGGLVFLASNSSIGAVSIAPSSRLEGNTAGLAGGLLHVGEGGSVGSLAVTNASLSDNAAGSGGLVSVDGGGSLRNLALTGSRLTGNKATSGSGGCVFAQAESVVGNITISVSLVSLDRKG